METTYNKNQEINGEVLAVLRQRRKTMKKLIQVLCTIFFATTISLPADAIANSNEEFDDPMEEQTGRASASDNYQLALVTGDFGLQLARANAAEAANSPMIFVSDPAGKIIKNAQVITTIIDSKGRQEMSQAWPFKGGYLVSANHLASGRYRIEAEIITNGRLLTDEFSFVRF
jgi:hypothetical protein